MEKELLGLSPGNHIVIWKRVKKGTNAFYEKVYTSLVDLLGAFAAVDATCRGARPVQLHH